MSATEAELAGIAALIQELGYRAQIADGLIRTAMSGWAVLVLVWPGESIQMYFGLSVDAEDGFGFEQANEFNKSYRFVKCYTGDGTAGFEQDFYFDASQSDAKDKLEQIFSSWEGSIGSALEALREARRRHHEHVEQPAPPN